MNHLQRAALTLCTSSAVLGTSLPARATDHDGSVTITGQRQAYRGDFQRLETPHTDLSLDAATLQAAGAMELSRALDLSASVARQNNFGGLWNAFALRGFTGDENLPSHYLVNGFNAGRGFGGPRDLSGIDSVEVLKGPRAALFGRGEPGGTVNLRTKRPGAKAAGELRLSAGSFDTYRIDADWTAPVSDTLALRLVGFGEDAGSFRDTVRTRRHGASPSLAWRIGRGTRLVYELEYSQQAIPFDRGVLAIGGQLGAIPRSRFLGEPGDGAMRADVLGHQIELQHDLSAHWSALLGLTSRHTSLTGYSSEAELSVSRQSLWVDGRTLTRQRRYRDYDAHYQVLRAELNGRVHLGGQRHRLILGADADRFENGQVLRRVLSPSLASQPTPAQQQAIDVFAPVYGAYPLPAPAALTDRAETQRALGLFVQDQIDLGAQLQLRVGARHDSHRQTLLDRAASRSHTQRATRLSPQLGLVYRAAQTVSLYGSYGESFRPLSGTDAQGRGFEPNQSASMEAGAKFSLADGAIDANVALFRVTQKNMLVAADPGALTLAAIGRASSRGLEIDLQGELRSGLALWVSYAHVDARTDNAFNDANFGLPVPAGTPLLNVPRQTLSLQLAQAFTLSGRGLQLGGGLLHVGERPGEFTTRFTLPAYTLVRAFAAVDLAPGSTLRLDVDNLFDRSYYSNSFSQLWVQPGTPRSLRMSLAQRF